MPRKGAIELSLGFIVTVVFAVVLLSLAIVWLNQIMGGIGGLTIDMTKDAQLKLQETFQSTENTFSIWPDSKTLDRNQELWMSAGIKNNADDAQQHTFVINIIPAAASQTVCPEEDINACTAPGGSNLKTYMKKWLNWDDKSSGEGGGVIQPNNIGYKKIIVKVPSDARSGSYIFNVVACKDMSSYTQCTAQTLNWGGSAQQLTITVK